MQNYDNYEIHPIYQDENGFAEPCEPENATYFTLFGHLSGKGLQAIGDFPSYESANHIRQRLVCEICDQPLHICYSQLEVTFEDENDHPLTDVMYSDLNEAIAYGHQINAHAISVYQDCLRDNRILYLVLDKPNDTN